MSKSLYIIDGHAHIYAAFYAVRGLRSPSGEPTNATYGFLGMLLKLLRTRTPDILVVAMDSPGPTFRHQQFAEYKANRPAMPEELSCQIDRIQELLGLLHIPILAKETYEADDMIASLSRSVRGKDINVFICSKDKDLEQLIGPHTVIYDARNEKVLDAEELQAKKGLTPVQTADVLALSGDSSDNIPGVPGVGPKKASGLIQKYGNLDNVLANIDQVPGVMGKNLAASVDIVRQNRELVALRQDAEIGTVLDGANWVQPPAPELGEILTELGFNRYIPAIEELWGDYPAIGTEKQAPSQEETQYVLVDTDQKFGDFLKILATRKAIALDTETTGLDPLKAELVGISFSFQANRGYYLPFRAPLGQSTLSKDKHLGQLREVLQNDKAAKIGHNIKYDQLILKGAGISLAGISFDTMVASYLLESDRPSHSLKSLGRELLDLEVQEITELIGTGKKQISFDQVPLEHAYNYAARDADMAWQLQDRLAQELAQAGLLKLFNEVEMPLVEVLAEMQHNGIKIDQNILGQMSLELQEQAHELAQKICDLAGEPFNVDSPRQLSDVLFNKLGLKPVRKTKTGFSTDMAVLEKLQTQHPIAELALKYRQIAKLRNTYVDVLPRMVDPRTGRLHASFNQTMTATGRLSSSGPNLQNIPARNELGRQIRAAFIPSEPDNVLLTADYSQIELRVLAHFSKDEQLCRAFANQEDIHTFVAAQIFSVDPAEVTPEQRQQAKTVNFGIIYGQTPYGLSTSLGISTTEARAFIEQYHRRYPGIHRFLDQCVNQAEQTGFVQTILGRRRRIRNILSSNRAQQEFAKRTAINTVVQGSAADLIKVAMIRVHEHIREESPRVKLLLQIHDELVFELPEKQAPRHAEWIRELMSRAIPLDVPVVVDLAWGRNWLEGK